MLLEGRYQPPSEEEAVARTADVLEVFLGHDVPVLRIGLQASEGMSAEHAVAGYHPAMGELVKGEIYYRRLTEQLAEIPLRGETVTVWVPSGQTSAMIGHGGANRRRLREKMGLRMVVREDISLPPYRVIVDADDKSCV